MRQRQIPYAIDLLAQLLWFQNLRHHGSNGPNAILPTFAEALPASASHAFSTCCCPEAIERPGAIVPTQRVRSRRSAVRCPAEECTVPQQSRQRRPAAPGCSLRFSAFNARRGTFGKAVGAAPTKSRICSACGGAHPEVGRVPACSSHPGRNDSIIGGLGDNLNAVVLSTGEIPPATHGICLPTFRRSRRRAIPRTQAAVAQPSRCPLEPCAFPARQSAVVCCECSFVDGAFKRWRTFRCSGSERPTMSRDGVRCSTFPAWRLRGLSDLPNRALHLPAVRVPICHRRAKVCTWHGLKQTFR